MQHPFLIFSYVVIMLRVMFVARRHGIVSPFFNPTQYLGQLAQRQF